MEDPRKYNIERIKNLGQFILEIQFEDGKIHRIDFSKIRHKNWRKNLENLDYFNRVKINEWGRLEWPAGEDFKPEHLYYWEKFGKNYIQLKTP